MDAINKNWQKFALFVSLLVDRHRPSMLSKQKKKQKKKQKNKKQKTNKKKKNKKKG